MKHVTLVSLTLVIGTLGVAACDSNKNSPNSPQDRPPIVNGDATPPAAGPDAAGGSASATNSTTDSGSDKPAATVTDPTAAATTGESVPGTGDTRPVSKVVDDGFITTKTKAALLAESGLTSTDITVETRRGTVTLTGTVPTASQSAQAAMVARNIEGVTSVENHLKVK